MQLWILPAMAPFVLVGFWIWTSHQRKLADKHGNTPLAHDPDASRMKEEMKYLKDRVAVLEQITTDNHSTKQLEHDINQLKDS